MDTRSTGAPDPHDATSGSPDCSQSCDHAEISADVQGSGGVARRAPTNLRTERRGAAPAARAQVALLTFTAALIAVWLAVDPRTPDLAAQVYRVGLFNQLGLAVWDEHWYLGHSLPGYSLLYPPLASLLGIRALGALCVLASTALFARLATSVYGEAARWGAPLFAVAALGDVWIGRMTFALGVSLALAAGLALMRERWLWAGLLAALCAAASPVAAVLLALAALSVALARRTARLLVVAAVPGAVVVLALAALFPEGGYEPYPILSFAATMAVVLAFVVALPRAARVLRLGAWLYLAACVACLLVNSPMGSNIERYAVLLAGPLLLCARLADPARSDGRARRAGHAQPAARAGHGRRRGASVWRRVSPLGAAALSVIMVWVVWGPVRETLAVAGSEATSAAYYVPVERFLDEHAGGPVRVEVPLTRSHWEAALLAPTVSLARGWEKQLEMRYDGVLLAHGLTAASYERWLHEQAVSYVALPDVALDPSSAQEGTLIRRGLPYLREVFASAHWRIFRVLGATPLASGPGRLTSLGHDSFALLASAPGRFVVRVHFTRYWTLTSGSGCVAQAPGGWTAVSVRATGTTVVTASFSLSRAFSSGGSCSSGASHANAARAGASSGAAAGSPAQAPASGHANGAPASYRWLVATEGAPPSIAAENRARGTRAWRLPGPAHELGGAARGAIVGYVAEQAIAPGEAQSVYVSAPRARTVTVRVYRMGWYGGLGGRLVLASARLPARSQPPCAHRLRTGLTECRWHATLSFPIPSALASGVYIVKLRASTGAESDCMFVLHSRLPPRLLVEIPTATYEAYNAWGGDSLYPGGSERVGLTGTTQGVEVSYDRPYDSQTGAGQFFDRDVAMVRFLERYGYPVGYTTIESIDGDPAQVLGPTHPQALIDVGHSEYWSQGDERAFERARDGGTSLLFISSDTMAWRVRFARASAASSQAGERDHRIVSYKEFAAVDPDRADPTGLFPRGGAQLVGSAYNGCITPRVEVRGPPVYGYYAWRPSPSLSPGWLFAGTGVTAATSIQGIVGYELDERTPATPAGTVLVGTGTGVPCGLETEPSPVRGSIAETTLYTARSGALVFATGTLGWEYALSPVPQASPEVPRAPDARVVAMTRNLLARVLGERR
ncbi:MAG TPA: N,N-dimethylformamidase beta subunit family domain-containing protein [Solirubrobacteraceae bacterium]|nr:N,N-dimethylformamidase beta subunit family domain-containing protein [Solirubrobacteraceae bacterium]